MIKNFIQSTRLALQNVVRQGKRKSLAFLPGKFRHSGGKAELPPPVSGDAEAEQPPEAKAAGPQQKHTVSAGGSRPRKREKWRLESFEVEPLEGSVRFHDIGLPLPLMHAISDLEFRYCTAVQAESIPHLLEGRDLVANANTGTGKTAVFLIAAITRLLRQKKQMPAGAARSLVIAPTRELVIQIAKDAKLLSRYCNLRIAAVYGGTDYQRQMEYFRERSCDIVVATPGRLLDFCQKRVIDLRQCEILVIDEADRMLDMGFIPDVRRIVHQLPGGKERQTLMFSATITEEVNRLAEQWCRNPVNVAIEPEQVAVESVEQLVYLVTSAEKYSVLYNLIQGNAGGRIAVFANQKSEAGKLYDRLRRNGIDCTLLTGDVPQKKRMERLEQFRTGKVQVLVATDVAGRGLHVEDITHVVNYSLPYEPEDYVHRIGRTGRAGAAGVSISFACEEGSFVLPDIEKFIGRKLKCCVPDEHLLEDPPKGTVATPQGPQRRPDRKKGGRNRAKRYVKPS
ncbi:MAG: DEAD/DEAH box helicase [Desulfopila sp.]|jgi:ATP-dependent RNA helicase RhlB|nr:DEAD/DEAH box helicase [Desulfopila sp.]